jgi:AraC-like DNA-binding protein
MAQKSRSCAACLQTQQALHETATHEPQTVTCQMGLCDTAVPVRVGDKLIGYLQTGQIFRKKPTETQFQRTLKLARDWGVEVNEPELRAAYFNSRLLSTREHDVVRQDNAEPPVIAKAKEFIREHQAENLSLGQVAKAVNTSTFYFCKMFKKVTGVNFTDYVSRVRIEKAKDLLLNPNLRVSEIAYEVGFQSLTHFNRVFKRILGQSPTEYRGQLQVAA